MPSRRIWRRVSLVGKEFSEECSTSIIRVSRIGVGGATILRYVDCYNSHAAEHPRRRHSSANKLFYIKCHLRNPYAAGSSENLHPCAILQCLTLGYNVKDIMRDPLIYILRQRTQQIEKYRPFPTCESYTDIVKILQHISHQDSNVTANGNSVPGFETCDIPVTVKSVLQ
jgi:hypothetical protein